MRRVVAAVLVAAMPAFAGLPAAVAEPERTGYEQVVDLTFPVSGPSSYSNDYHAHRGGGARRHQATDVFADKLQHIHAAVGGEIIRITGIDEPMPSWGYQIVIRGDDGREYGYVHLNNDNPGTDDGEGGPELAYAPGMRKGVRVERGQWIGYVGDSGNAETTPPHLHFSIHDPDLVDERLAEPPYQQGRINPFFSFEAARARGDIPERPNDPNFDGPSDPAPVDTEPERAPVAARRLAGDTRVATAVRLSAERTSARTVVVAPATTHVNALVAAPLAGLLDAPVLLTAASRLESGVADEVARLGAINAYVVGSRDELHDAVEDGLRAAGVRNLARLDAGTVPGLSAAVAREIRSYPQVTSTPRVLLALGESEVASRAWPDALSASALAAHTRTPILLVRGSDLPAEVAEVLTDLRPERITVVGGEAAITERVVEAARTAAGDATVERLAGETRYQTSIAVAEAGIDDGLDEAAVWLATGRNFPDALAAGPAAARAHAPLLLVDGTRLTGAPEPGEWLARAAARLDAVTLVGGEAVITPEVEQALGGLLVR